VHQHRRRRDLAKTEKLGPTNPRPLNAVLMGIRRPPPTPPHDQLTPHTKTAPPPCGAHLGFHIGPMCWVPFHCAGCPPHLHRWLLKAADNHTTQSIHGGSVLPRWVHHNLAKKSHFPMRSVATTMTCLSYPHIHPTKFQMPARPLSLFEFCCSAPENPRVPQTKV